MGTSTKNKKNPWKEKAKDRGEKVRRLKQKVTRQTVRAEKWKEKYNILKSSTKVTLVRRHKYPLELIWMAILMVTNFNISLRGASKSLSKLGELLGLQIDKISPTTIRNWSLKYGFHCLLQPITSGKYVIISDESVEIGREHLLLLLVVPIEKYSPILPLNMSDVKVLDLSIQESWKGDEISEMIQKKIDEHGIELLYGISDKGHNLLKAYKNLNIPWIGDCTHEIANQTQSIFKENNSLNDFMKAMKLLRAKWIMSKHNNLYVPPNLRVKSRFHEIFIVHKWGQRILEYWKTIPSSAKEELKFVKQAESLIRLMESFHYLIEEFTKIFKSKGIQKTSLAQWEKSIKNHRQKNEKDWTEQEEQFITAMNNYLNDQKAKLPNSNQILCCSDIIESMFGKYKNKGGIKMITEDVLKIAAYPKDKNIFEIKQAIEQVKIVDVLNWKNNNTTISKLALLKRNKKKSAA
jgi:hypothetical protein